MSKSKIVDLEMSNDGSYSPKTKKSKAVVKFKSKPKPKYLIINEVDEFLGGIDAGLDFLEGVVPRIDRFLRLRG